MLFAITETKYSTQQKIVYNLLFIIYYVTNKETLNLEQYNFKSDSRECIVEQVLSSASLNPRHPVVKDNIPRSSCKYDFIFTRSGNRLK